GSYLLTILCPWAAAPRVRKVRRDCISCNIRRACIGCKNKLHSSHFSFTIPSTMVDVTDEIICERIRQWRKALGWKQFQVAEQLGVDPSTWSRIENGETGPMGLPLSRLTE